MPVGEVPVGVSSLVRSGDLNLGDVLLGEVAEPFNVVSVSEQQPEIVEWSTSVVLPAVERVLLPADYGSEDDIYWMGFQRAANESSTLVVEPGSAGVLAGRFNPRCEHGTNLIHPFYLFRFFG